MGIFQFIKKQFKGVLKKIPTIAGIPADNIPSWCYERQKVIRPDPLKPSKTKTVKEKELDIPSLQNLLIEYRDKMNQIIITINQIPEIEKQMWELDNRLSEQMADLQNQINLHRAPKGYQGPNTLRSTDGHHKHPYYNPNMPFIPGMEEGGKIKPKPTKRNQKNINSIKTKYSNKNNLDEMEHKCPGFQSNLSNLFSDEKTFRNFVPYMDTFLAQCPNANDPLFDEIKDIINSNDEVLIWGLCCFAGSLLFGTGFGLIDKCCDKAKPPDEEK
tara:strand:- start:44 stop:859 length:816 start_codon:yes stop_codon:yes gene_type:complete